MSEPVGAWYLVKGDKFTYAGERYLALDNPRGEHSTIIKIRDLRTGKVDDIYIPDSNRVTILELGEDDEQL